MTRYETVEFPDPKDWKAGDLFEGTYKKDDFGVQVEIRVKGVLRGSDRTHSELYVWVKAPYVTGSGASQWTNVRVTREVPVPPTLEETLEALPHGSVVFNQDHRDTKIGRGTGTWTFNKNHGWWVSATGFEKDSASFANFLLKGGYSYKIVNRDEVEV